MTCISARSLEVTGRRVLAIGGAESGREGPANTMKLVADDVQTLVIPRLQTLASRTGTKELLAALTPFLSPTGTTRPRSTPP